MKENMRTSNPDPNDTRVKQAAGLSVMDNISDCPALTVVPLRAVFLFQLIGRLSPAAMMGKLSICAHCGQSCGRLHINWFSTSSCNRTWWRSHLLDKFYPCVRCSFVLHQPLTPVHDPIWRLSSGLKACGTSLRYTLGSVGKLSS
jgi:hypothetical protein